MIPLRLAPRFTAADADAAHASWRANCGPAAIAATTGLTLDEVRPFLGDFERTACMNPTMVMATLNRLPGVRWRWLRLPDWPAWGLMRVQWHGPWLAPGVPPAAAYRHTHWVGVAKTRSGAEESFAIFDVNALGTGSALGAGWLPFAEWRDSLVPWLLEHSTPRADGRWSVTHAIEVMPI